MFDCSHFYILMVLKTLKPVCAVLMRAPVICGCQ